VNELGSKPHIFYLKGAAKLRGLCKVQEEPVLLWDVSDGNV